MKTYVAKDTDVQRKWLIVDAEDKVLGRLACQVADILRGKDKPTFTPHVDTGDNIIVINASKIKVTGKKIQDKIYYRHSQYPGGLKSETLSERLKKNKSGRVFYDAVKGMLPKNKLSNSIIKKLKIYPGVDHPHTAQKPETIQ